RADGGRHIPALIGVEHQLNIRPYRLADSLDALVIVFDGEASADAPHLELDRVEALVHVPPRLADQFRNALPLAVVTAGYVNGNGIAIAAEELVDRKARDLGHNVVECSVDSRHRRDYGVCAPAAGRRLASVRDGKH